CLKLGPDGGKESRAHASEIHFIVLAVVRMPNNSDPLSVPIEADRQHRGNTYGLHARQAFQSAQNLFRDSDSLFFLGVGSRIEVYRRRGQMIWLESDVKMQKAIQALTE